MTAAILALADGRVFTGRACGATGEAHGEVVFNTSMTGYQEILTDPSYRGQLVCMTYPLIGNYGINGEDVESRRPWVNGFIVKEACGYPSSWRGRVPIETYMREHGIVGIQGIDTRALTRHLRDRGAQEGIISTVETDGARLAERARALPGLVGNFFSIDLAQARHAFETVPWVRRAVVRRVWPDRLAVRLQEHHAVELWESNDGSGPGDRLVNSQGEVFEANLGDVEDEALPRSPGRRVGLLRLLERVGRRHAKPSLSTAAR